MAYTKQNTYTKGQKARAESVDAEFTAMENAGKLTIEITTATAVNQITENATTRADKLIGFDTSGDVELKQSTDLTSITTPGSPTANSIVRWVSATQLQDTGWTIDGSDNLNAADSELGRPVLKDYGETVNNIGAIGGGTQDIDLESGNYVAATVDTSTTTFTFSNPSASGTACSFTLELTNGGSQTVNWPASVDWAGGSAPTLTSSGVDFLTFVTRDAGTTWYGFVAGLDMQ